MKLILVEQLHLYMRIQDYFCWKQLVPFVGIGYRKTSIFVAIADDLREVTFAGITDYF